MIDNYIKKHWAEIEARLEKLVPKQEIEHKLLFEAARYSLLGSGKRMRPILTIATTEALGEDIEKAFIPACALEMVHTYSLIHDDLPCMDNDDFRRGKPTLHKKYDAGIATLTGDFLLTHAFQVLAEAPKLNTNQKIALVKTLAKDAGGSGMVAGQLLDIEAKKNILDLKALKNIHRKKSGALICAAVEFGTIVASADKSTKEHLRLFGEEIGLAFQIVDDLLDADESKASDQPSFVTLLGVSKSKKMASELLNSAIERLHGLKLEKTPLNDLAKKLVHRQI